MNKSNSPSRKYILILPVFLIFLYGCTQKIDIKIDDTYTRLVVDGSITNDSIVHWVKLSLTSSYFYNQSEPMVSGANVAISDGSSTWNLLENPLKKGYYYSSVPFKGVVGRNYNLQVQNVSIGGNVSSYSAQCALAPNGRMDSIEIASFSFSGFSAWIVKLYAQDPPDTANFYMFNLYKNGVLITDTIKNVQTSNDILFDGNYTNGIQVQYLDKVKANPGDTITLEMAGITKEYFTFLEALKAESNVQIPLFSGPPANVIGNVSNGALGYFAAYSVARASAIVPSSKKPDSKEPLGEIIKKSLISRHILH